MGVIGWVIFALLSLCIIGGMGWICLDPDIKRKWVIVLIAVFLIFAVYGGVHWYFTSTASGRRAVVDERSDLSNGLERTVTVYTADGNVIAQYSGKLTWKKRKAGMSNSTSKASDISITTASSRVLQILEVKQ